MLQTTLMQIEWLAAAVPIRRTRIAAAEGISACWAYRQPISYLRIASSRADWPGYPPSPKSVAKCRMQIGAFRGFAASKPLTDKYLLGPSPLNQPACPRSRYATRFEVD
jgi:hypothetical protein